MTSKDMLIAAELNQRKAEAMGREKDKKSRVEYHARRVRPHSPSLTASKTSSKTMSGG